MLEKFVIKLMGAGIAAAIQFLAPDVEYGGNALIVRARLTSPVTSEITELAKHDFEFGIEYYVSIIIDDRKVYRGTIVNALSYDNGWKVNGEPVPVDSIQSFMGRVRHRFDGAVLSEGDRLLLFVKATILPDEIFRQSTGMPTRILWNHYVPRIKRAYIFERGRLVPAGP